MSPKLGEHVVYTLTEDDARAIQRAREESGQTRKGNSAWHGEKHAAVVVRVFGGGGTRANLQVLLDGNDHYWATSVPQGAGDGHWTVAE